MNTSLRLGREPDDENFESLSCEPNKPTAEFSSDITTITCDHTDEQAVADVCRYIDRTSGRLDILDIMVDFSRNAGVYDDRHGAFIADDLAQRLIAEAGLAAASTVLDIGAGTGRVAIPFAARSCRVVALDPSAPMLQRLREKSQTGSLRVAIGGAAALPFPDAAFDAVVIARLLYLLPEWRRVLDEAVRVLRDGARLLHEWGNGDPDEDWVQIRERARALFESAGVTDPFHPGARHEPDVDRALVECGMTRCGDVRAASGERTTMARFLDRVDSGECSYIWNVPPDVQRTCLPRLRTWAAERFDLEREVPVPRELRWTIYCRRNA